MLLSEVFSAKKIASVHTEVASNKIPYLGEGLFPRKKKMGLDLSWIKTSKGLPVSLKPSAFDTVSTIRSREGIKIEETEMAFFKESMLVKEKDEQEIMRVLDSNDPYAKDVLNKVFDDANTLVDGANVVPERMIMQLLATDGGHPSISISADGSTYAYNYDPNNTYSANNYHAYSGTSAWSDHTNADPLKDIADAMDVVETRSGSRPAKAIMNKTTFNHVKQCAKIKNYILAQNVSANVMITDARVKELFATELGIAILVYDKQFINDSGVAQKFYPDGFCTLIPDGVLGNTWFGTTPEERTLLQRPEYDCAIVDGGVAVTVSVSNDPVQTKTTVSEIVLPSFERMDETYTMKVIA